MEEVIRIRGPGRADGKVFEREEVYNTRALPEYAPVWIMRWDGFRLARQKIKGEEFTVERCLIETQQPEEIKLEVSESQAVILHCLEGRLTFDRLGQGVLSLTTEQSLVSMIAPGNYTVCLSAGGHHILYGYISRRRLKKLAEQYESVEVFLSGFSDYHGSFYSKKLSHHILQFSDLLNWSKPDESAAGILVDAGIWGLLDLALDEAGSTKVKLGEKAGAKQTIFQVRAYLDELANGERPLPRVEELADRFHLHPRNLSRVFKAEFGETPRDYIHRLRMEAGYSLLAGGMFRVDQVAYRLGYQNAFNFRREFRRFFGFPPGKVKHKMKK